MTVEKSGFRWRGQEISRLEQFSDAVFAFALALLVVSTELPRSMEDLHEVLRGFLAFGATFAVLAWIWYLHYQYFRRYGLTDVITITLNCGLLFLVLFYVYPLRFLFGALLNSLLGARWVIDISQSDDLLVIYSAGFIAVFGMFALLYRRALAHKDVLGLSEREIDITRTEMLSHVFVLSIGLASMTIALTTPSWLTPVAGFMYFLIGPVKWWHWSRVKRRWRAAEAKTES